MAIGSLVSIECNGADVTPDAHVDYDNDKQYCNSTYMRFNEYEFKIETCVGDNQIIFTYTGGNNGGNLDYIEIKNSDCVLTDKTPGWQDTESEWEIVQAPTASSNGKISVTSLKPNGTDTATNEYEMLPLSEENGYTKSSIGGKDVYFISVIGNTFGFYEDGTEYIA